ncbi:MAG: SMC-Scp complex subunit ScpB [Acidiferrobacterales bacterium]
MTDVNTELRNILEAALLVAGQPLTIDRMMSLFPEGSRPTREDLRAALAELEREYTDRPLELRQIDNGYRLQTRQKYGEWIARLSEERPVRYSRALLETLAIIVYRQPVTRAEIEEIRGVAVSSEIIKTLLGREWVRQVGQRDVPGRPALYGTARGFLEHFNLKSLDELPPLAELRDIETISAELNLSLPMDSSAPASGVNAPTADVNVDVDAADDPDAGSEDGEQLAAEFGEAQALKAHACDPRPEIAEDPAATDAIDVAEEPPPGTIAAKL